MGGFVRCVDCEPEPLTPGHFCECCGRKLSVAERTTLEANPAPAPPVAEASRRAACESCGGPSNDGPLCESCQSTFQSVIDSSTSAPWTPAIAHRVEQSVSTPASSATQSPAPEIKMLAPAFRETAGGSFNTDWNAMDAVETHPEPVAAETTLPSTAAQGMLFAASEAPTDGSDAVETEPAHAEAARVTATVAEAATSESADAGVARAETASPDIASSPEAEFTRAETAYFETAATEPEPVRENKSPAVSAQQSRAQWMGLTAAAVIAVAAMGVPLGVWLGTRHSAQPEPRAGARTRCSESGCGGAPAGAPAPAAAVSAPPKDREVLPSQPQAVAVAQPKTSAPALPPAKASTRTPAKTARKFEAPRPIALQPVPVQMVQQLAASPVVEPQVAEPLRIVAPTPPVGRLFEPADVDESPRVATRVEPQLSGDAVKRFPNDVVVVRVLVSQTGHPFRVSLLRRSLGGRTLDDAVVAAVSQWTFSPARKRGEVVSCWMNFGVQVGR